MPWYCYGAMLYLLHLTLDRSGFSLKRSVSYRGSTVASLPNAEPMWQFELSTLELVPRLLSHRTWLMLLQIRPTLRSAKYAMVVAQIGCSMF